MYSETVNEALLENVFSRPIALKVAEIYGADRAVYLKPTQPAERRLGFDAAYVYGQEKDTEAILATIKDAIASGNPLNPIALLPYKITSRNDVNVLLAALRDSFAEALSLGKNWSYFGFFLQYKAVESIVGNNHIAQDHVKAPCFRVKVDCHVPTEDQRNSAHAISQHEVLRRLSQNQNDTFYACPFIDTPSVIFSPEVDLSLVRLVRCVGSPAFENNSSHHIYFPESHRQSDDIVWMSDPVPGKSIGADAWIRTIKPEPVNSPKLRDLLLWSAEFSDAPFYMSPSLRLVLLESS